MASLINMFPEGVAGVAGVSGALAAETMGHTGQAAAAGAVVPPGLDPDISPVNSTKITAYTAQVAAMLAASGALQQMYAASNGTAAASYSFTEALNAIGVNAIAAVSGL
ncbi:hypothetical protein KIH27_20590 [Mycobacterium sp. M1]|uniref:PE family protein n=1 Tax=Mycolicibacter acidiphilus TaxID=2835306 RepID=A0ABS5RNV6_9MYCO|nr:hypothetical protein [Mycolicibacter acidiphilus]MBS9535985.1 hypothetical protein [Mycolicibacter acidiphilus]